MLEMVEEHEDTTLKKERIAREPHANRKVHLPGSSTMIVQIV
jgi:hypothetical protein